MNFPPKNEKKENLKIRKGGKTFSSSTHRGGESPKTSVRRIHKDLELGLASDATNEKLLANENLIPFKDF